MSIIITEKFGRYPLVGVNGELTMKESLP